MQEYTTWIIAVKNFGCKMSKNSLSYKELIILYIGVNSCYRLKQIILADVDIKSFITSIYWFDVID